MEILLKFWPIAAALGWLLLIWIGAGFYVCRKYTGTWNRLKFVFDRKYWALAVSYTGMKLRPPAHNRRSNREQSSQNRAINVSASQVVRMAQILTPDTSQVKGSSWSGKVPLTGDQLEELYQIGRTGALSFSFEDHSLEDHLV